MSIDTNQPTHEIPERKQRVRQRKFMVALGAFAVAVVVVGAAALLASGDGDGLSAATASDDPAEVIKQYIAAYNSGDIDAMMAAYTEDSVLYGYSDTSEVAGLTALRAMWTGDLAEAASTDAWSISNVEVDGDTVTWDQVWVDNAGENHCMEGQSAVIKDGKILIWTWSSVDPPCS